MFSRTLGQLGEVGAKAVTCGKLVKLFSGKIRQGAVLVVMKLAVRVNNSVKKVHNCTDNAVKALEEKKKE